MSVDKDPEVYKFLVGAVMALLGGFTMVGLFILKLLFNRSTEDREMIHKNKEDIIEINTRCEERAKNDRK